MKDLELAFDNTWARLHKRHDHVEEFKAFFEAGYNEGREEIEALRMELKQCIQRLEISE